MTPTPTTQAAPPRPAEQTHPCVRCGRPVPLDVAMCEYCNPLGLSQPATTQVHGTVVVAVMVAVVLLALLGRLALSGVGPFQAKVAGVTPVPNGLTVTISLHNQGTRVGATTCRLTDAAKPGYGAVAVVQTPRIEAGQTRQFTTTVREFGTTPVSFSVECDSP
jgi:hypothetical protein